MRNSILLLSFFFLFACNSEQEQIVERFEDGTPKTIIKKQNNEIIKFEYYKSGNKKLMIHMKDTVENGKYNMWYESGELWVTGNVIDGKESDTMKEYYRNGNLSRIKFYIDNKMKIYRRYDTLGRKTTEINDIKDVIYAWYKSGQLKLRIPHVEGDFIKYHENGRILFLGKLKDGKKDGMYYYFSEEGDTLKSIEYALDEAVDSVIYSP